MRLIGALLELRLVGLLGVEVDDYWRERIEGIEKENELLKASLKKLISMICNKEEISFDEISYYHFLNNKCEDGCLQCLFNR